MKKLYNLPIIVIVVLILTVFFSIRSHKQESRRSKLIPISFAEIEQLMNEVDTLDLMNEYIPKVNDCFSKIFEANNETYKYTGDGSHRSFARELENHMILKNIYPYNLTDLLNEIPILSQKLLIEKKEYVKAYEQIVPFDKSINKSWEYDSRSNYHTETRYSTDAEANTTSYTVQVYDDTDHYFDYDKENGEFADKLGYKFLKEIPLLKLEKIYVASATNADGEYGAEKSRKNLKNSKHGQLDYLDLSRNWFRGSTLLHTSRKIEELRNKLKPSINNWNINKNTANEDTYHYNTYSRWHDGPEEYQSAERLSVVTGGLRSNLYTFIITIQNTRDDVKTLHSLINKYIKDVYTYDFNLSKRQNKKLLNKQRNEILDITKKMYFMNFKHGIELNTYRMGRVVIPIVIGFIILFVIGMIEHNKNR